MDTTAQNPTFGSSSTGPASGAATGEPGPATSAGSQLPGDDPAAAGTAGSAGSAGPVASGLGDRLASYRLRRSATDRMLGGVCGGLARDLGADVALLRVLVLVLTLISGGAAALVYLAAWLVAPVE